MATAKWRRSSLPEDVRDLFAEYANAYARGEQPEARDYLERAGSAADELARLLEDFLVAAPRPPADADAFAVVSAWAEGEPPLVHLRASHGVRVDEVVDAIVDDAGVAAAKREKVKRYYQRLEQGLLDPRGVSERVWNTVRRLVGPAAEAAASWQIRPAEPQVTYFRAAGAPLAAAALRDAPREPERDEVDELFTRPGQGSESAGV
jgi:hypothetical protein